MTSEIEAMQWLILIQEAVDMMVARATAAGHDSVWKLGPEDSGSYLRLLNTGGVLRNVAYELGKLEPEIVRL